MTVMYWIEQRAENIIPPPMTMTGAQRAERKVPGTEELSMQGG